MYYLTDFKHFVTIISFFVPGKRVHCFQTLNGQGRGVIFKIPKQLIAMFDNLGLDHLRSLGVVEMFWDQDGVIFHTPKGVKYFVHASLSDSFNKCYKNTVSWKNNLILLYKI